MEAVKAQFRKTDRNGAGTISEDALAQLIAKLCGEIVSAPVIGALLESFDGGKTPGRSINYNEFIEWLFESLEATGGAPSSLTQGLQDGGSPKAGAISLDRLRATSQNYHLFCSNQHTEEAKLRRAQWLEGTAESVKVSAPPFNTRLGIALPDGTVELNIATFGVKLPRVIMKFFESEELMQLSQELQIPIPRYALDSFVQKKMPKVMDLVREARKPEANLNQENLDAVARLEKFCLGFEALDRTTIAGPLAFKEFVEQHVKAGWEDQLHFDSVLVANFGFDKSASDWLRKAEISVLEKDKEVQVSLEHHAVRWLAKAFRGYGPVGCLTDVVNLVYAMLGRPQPLEASEDAAIEVMQAFQDRLSRKDFAGLWIPTHLVHDAESDDALSWLLLEHIHKLNNTRLEVLIQLPADEKLDSVASFLKSHSAGVQVFRDKDSTNGKAVSGTWGAFLPKTV